MHTEIEPTTLDFRPALGLSCRVTAPAESTGGEYVEMDCTAEPGFATIVHYHPQQDETYRVLSGEIEILSEGRWRPLREGESLEMPKGKVHAFRNASDRPARFVNRHTPALGFQAHLETVHRLKEAGKIRGLSDPRSLIYMSMSAARHRPDVAVRPPQWLADAMAALGRRLGFRLE